MSEIYIYTCNATPIRLPGGNWTCDPWSLDQRSTNGATEVVAVSLGASSVYVAQSVEHWSRDPEVVGSIP